jgi:hypothetical protein
MSKKEQLWTNKFQILMQILEIVVLAVVKDVPDASGNASGRLAPKLQKFLDLVLSKYSSPKFFQICADYYHAQNQYSKYLEFEEKSYRAILHSPTLNEDMQVFETLVDATIRLVDGYAFCQNIKEIPRMGQEEVLICPNWAYKAKMALKSVIGRTKSSYQDTEKFSILTDKLLQLK